MADDMWRVLIIDDSPEEREAMRIMLKRSERRFRFIEAETGADGLRACLGSGEDPPDCILLDYHLPDCDAPEMLRALGGPDSSRYPVVVMTGSSGHTYDAAVLRLGAQDFIGKGWMNTESLTRCVENAIERFVMLRELRDREERLDLTLAAANLGTWDYNPVAGTFVCNSRCKELFGLPPDTELDYEIFLACVHCEDRERVALAIQRAFDPAGEGGYAIEYRTVIPQMEGVPRWLHAVGQVFFDPKRRASRFVGTVRDITEGKQAESALRESEAFTRGILDAMDSHVAVLDRDGHIVAVNESWRLFALENGRPATHTDIGVNYLDICREAVGGHAEGALAIHDGIRAVLTGTLQTFTLDYPCHSPDRRRWFTLAATPLRAEVGGAVVTHTDITAIRVLAEELRENEALLRAYYESSPACMGMVELADNDILHLYDNPATCRFFGVEPGATAGRWSSGLGTPPEAIAAWREKYRESARRREPVNFELAHDFPGQPRRWLDSTVTPLPGGPSGRPRFCYVSLDITAHKRLEDQLRGAQDGLKIRVLERTLELEQANERLGASEARFRWLFDCDMVGIGYWQADGTVLDANQALLRLLGYTREDVAAGLLNWRALTPANHRHADEAALQELAEHGLITPFEKEYLHKDGRRIQVLVGAAARSTAMDQGVFFVLDISERKRAEAQVRRMSVEVTLAEDRERKAIAQDLHDDLGQLLHVAKIKLYALAKAGSKRAREPLLQDLDELLGNASHKVRSLTSQLSPPVLQTLGLIPALSWLAEELERVYGMEIEVEDDDAPKPLNPVQAMIVFRAVRELLINVAKHSGVQRARVIARSDGADLSIEVVDGGVGIADIREALLAGKGYGLASILDRLRFLNGTLDILSPPQGGTVAKLCLPFVAPATLYGDEP